MLTDYHTHLRPDDLDAHPGRYFNEENLERYLAAAHRRGIAEVGISEHVYRFKQSIAIWDHPFWRENATDDLDEYCEFLLKMKDAGHGVKLGIEVDWLKGREDQLAALIDGYPWDYVLGSVHFLGKHSVDHPDYDVWHFWDAEEIWESYFDALGEAAESGLFDVLAHPDLVKIWGRRPDGDLRRFYERALGRIAGADVAVEVSTAGLRKPVKEIYPSRELLELVVEAGKPVSLSSDAHAPDDVGFRFDLAQELLHGVGVEEISVFNERKRSMKPLGGDVV